MRERARKGDGSWTDLGKRGWRYQFSLGVLDGKRVRKSVTGRTQQECRDLAAKEIDRWHKEQPGTADEPLSSFLARWLKAQAKRVRPNTVDAYAGAIAHALPVIGKVRLRDLTHRDIEQVMTAVTDKGRSTRTANMVRTVLGTALRDAMRDGLLTSNPASLARAKPANRPLVEPLTPEQARTLLETTRGSRWWPLYAIALSLGLRQGELLALRWDDVEGDALYVRHTLRAAKRRYHLDPPKTAGSARRLPMTALVTEALRLQRIISDSDPVLAGKSWQKGFNGLGLVFRTPQGRPLYGKHVTEQFHADLAAANLPRRRFHDLRHSCATFLLAEGVDLKVIQEVLRHSSIAVTASTYAHVSDATMRDALDKLDWLRGA